MTFVALSRRMTELGRPVPPLGLRRMEAGERRVDVDDLLALARALEVSPIVLLLPANVSLTDAIKHTAVGEVSSERMRRWLGGEPLGDETLEALTNELDVNDFEALEMFERDADVRDRPLTAQWNALVRDAVAPVPPRKFAELAELLKSRSEDAD